MVNEDDHSTETEDSRFCCFLLQIVELGYVGLFMLFMLQLFFEDDFSLILERNGIRQNNRNKAS